MVLQKMKCSSEWAGLPIDILDAILDRLVALRDYVRFGAVCVQWHSITLEDRNYRGIQKRQRRRIGDGDGDTHTTTTTTTTSSSSRSSRFWDHQLPMLMIPRRAGGIKAHFYSVTDDKELQFVLPVLCRNRFIGSCFGWLISVDTDFVITLFNPFFDTTTIHLPPVMNRELMVADGIVFDFDFERLSEKAFNHEYYFVKAILSANPALHPDEYVVMVIYGRCRRLAYIRPSNSEQGWVYLNHLDRGFCDILYSRSSGLFYALHVTGALALINTNDGEKFVNERICISKLTLEIESPCYHRYIVESCGGDLLQVLRLVKHDIHMTVGFRVFKLIDSTPLSYWVELKSLGDDALFVGDNSSLSVMASDFPGCRPDSIYYSVPYDPELLIKNKPLPYPSGPYDMALGHLDKREPYKVFNIQCHLIIPGGSPIWVVPTFVQRRQL